MQWFPTTGMTTKRALHAAALLGDGTVMVAGGEKDFLTMNWLASTEVYDPGHPY
jgi:hypothetical protein